MHSALHTLFVGIELNRMYLVVRPNDHRHSTNPKDTENRSRNSSKRRIKQHHEQYIREISTKMRQRPKVIEFCISVSVASTNFANAIHTGTAVGREICFLLCYNIISSLNGVTTEWMGQNIHILSLSLTHTHPLTGSPIPAIVSLTRCYLLRTQLNSDQNCIQLFKTCIFAMECRLATVKFCSNWV